MGIFMSIMSIMSIIGIMSIILIYKYSSPMHSFWVSPLSIDWLDVFIRSLGTVITVS